MGVKLVTDQLLKQYSMEQYRHVPTGHLSGGNKRKLCAATSMLGAPDIILMDEPTSGMDPSTRRLVWSNIENMVKKGQSILLTSHSLAECDSLCDTVSIMAKGEVLCTGSPAKLKEDYGSGYRVNIKMNSESSVNDVLVYMNTNIEGAKLVEQRQNWLKYIAQGKISVLLGLLTAAKAQRIIDGFTIDVTSLEDIFLEITNSTDTIPRSGSTESVLNVKGSENSDHVFDANKNI